MKISIEVQADRPSISGFGSTLEERRRERVCVCVVSSFNEIGQCHWLLTVLTMEWVSSYVMGRG